MFRPKSSERALLDRWNSPHGKREALEYLVEGGYPDYALLLVEHFSKCHDYAQSYEHERILRIQKDEMVRLFCPSDEELHSPGFWLNRFNPERGGFTAFFTALVRWRYRAVLTRNHRPYATPTLHLFLPEFSIPPEALFKVILTPNADKPQYGDGHHKRSGVRAYHAFNLGRKPHEEVAAIARHGGLQYDSETGWHLGRMNLLNVLELLGCVYL